MTAPSDIGQLRAEARACALCASCLPLGPNPVFRIAAGARLVLASQAPSTGAHRSGTPWTDASGIRLRAWLGLSAERFFDAERVAVLPAGFCYPGRLPRGGDAPPRPECAKLWHPRMLAAMPEIRLVLLIGAHAQRLFLGLGARGQDAGMAARVRNHRAYLPRFFPLPHPSWRTAAWERRSPWFGEEVLPMLRAEVARALE